jgi:glycogen(starch) synthase
MTLPLRILVITNLYPPQVLGGYERSISDFARLLQHCGHTVLVLTSDTPQFSASHTSLYPDPPVERCLLLMGEWSDQGAHLFDQQRVADVMQTNQAILKHHLDQFQPDVCLAGNLRFVQLEAEGMALLLSHQVPVAHYLMNAQADYAPQHTPRSPLYRLITCSDWVTASLQTLGYPAATAQTIYPGADVDAFYQAELPPRDRLRIAYASLVAHYKGADVLVEALSLLHAAGIEFTATIAGGTFQPEFVEALKQFVESEGLQESVHFPGALSRQELIQLYKTHNVLVFPSRFNEPFGISQIEAMAAGLTLVTSGTGGAKEIIAESGNDGLIFESENPFDLADSLSSLPTDPARWSAIASTGQQRAMSKFSQAKAVDKLEAIFLELVNLKDAKLATKRYRIGRYSILLPIDHRLDQYQATWYRYDTALGYISQAVFDKYPQSSAIDIGANVGDSAALIRSGRAVPVLCVEGSPEFVECLRSNALQIGGIEIDECFVGDDGETINFDQTLNQGGTASIVNALTSNKGEKVAMRSLKTIIQNHSRFKDAKLLKIDTDGFDFSIIKASADIISASRPVLYFEYDLAFKSNAETEAIEAIKTLLKVGYEHFLIYDNFGNYLISLSRQDHERFVDLNSYLISNRRRSGTPAVYYFDVCAFTNDDRDLFETLRKRETDHSDLVNA